MSLDINLAVRQLFEKLNIQWRIFGRMKVSGLSTGRCLTLKYNRVCMFDDHFISEFKSILNTFFWFFKFLISFYFYSNNNWMVFLLQV